jgi:predicted lipoprotein with Yx(FWY)xxD motif
MEASVTLRARPIRLLFTLAPLALLAAACGDDSDDDAAGDATETTADGTTDTTASSDTTEAPDTTSATADGVTVEVADSSLGEILVSDGRTLYLFMPDNAGPSTCTGGCADAWPALVTDDGLAAGEGIDASLLATSPREDGSEQVTVDGWPLYFFSGDAAAGDVNGQGVNDVWYVVAPDGTAIEG